MSVFAVIIPAMSSGGMKSKLLIQQVDLAAEFHERNSIEAKELTVGSQRRVWWRCAAGHEWEAMVRARVRGSGCPICAGREIVPGINDVATTHPDIAAEWHPVRNSIDPTKLSIRSARQVWWRCAAGHEWQTQVLHRGKGTKCPDCWGRSLVPGANDLATLHPSIAAEFHPRNNTDPSRYLPGSAKQVLWQCTRGHEWTMAITDRVYRSRGCPECEGKPVLPPRRGAVTVAYSPVAGEWSDRNDRGPEEFALYSNKMAWWRCPAGHEYEAKIAHRTNSGSKCPYCSGLRVLIGFNDLATTHPEVLWAWDFERNDILPTQVSIGSTKKVWWRCRLGHETYASPNARSKFDQTTCQVCSGLEVRAGFNDLESQWPELVASEWSSEKNDILPSAVHCNSARKVWWRCPLGHEWRTAVVKRTREGQGCPVCANRIVVIGFNDLASDRPNLASEWHPELNGDLLSTAVTCGSNKKVWWRCGKGHEWRAAVIKRALYDHGCVKCLAKHTSRREQDVCSRLAEFFGLEYDGPTRIQGVRTPVDLFLPAQRTVVEYDGWYWHKSKLEGDNRKTSALRDLGLDVVRIREIYLGQKLPEALGVQVFAAHNEPADKVAKDVIDVIVDRAAANVAANAG